MPGCPTGTGNSKICGFADDTLTENANTAAAILSEFVSLDIYFPPRFTHNNEQTLHTHRDGGGWCVCDVVADQLSLLSIIMLGLGGWEGVKHGF